MKKLGPVPETSWLYPTAFTLVPVAMAALMASLLEDSWLNSGEYPDGSYDDYDTNEDGHWDDEEWDDAGADDFFDQ